VTKLLLLLDGLDEVPSTLRSFVYQQVTRYANSSAGMNCRVVITSRISGYSSLGASFKEFTLKPFENTEELFPYLRGWLAALQPTWTPNY
jgi:predicted NACHT family NTPase